MDDTDIDAIVTDLAGTGVHVGPGAGGWLTDRQLERITTAIDEADLPVNIVLVRPPDDAGIHPGDDLLVRVHDAGGPQGLYLGANSADPVRDGEAYGLLTRDGLQVDPALQQWGEVDGSSDLTFQVDLALSYANGPGDPFPLGEGLVRVVEALADGSFAALAEAGSEGLDLRTSQDGSDPGTDTGTDTGIDSGTAVGAEPATPEDGSTALGVGLVLGVLLLLVALGAAAAVAVRRRHRTARDGTTYALPDSLLDRVREAGDAELLRRARADVLALGERIDAADMRPGATGAAWAAALDHYEAAGRLLPADDDAAVDPLDATGAVVLADRGRAALESAQRGRAFVPDTPCFLNPLHGRATRDRALEHAGRRVDAPVCHRCRKDLEAGRRPDILDVVVDGRPRHYFETDREPWASTGFGALEPDLVGRLHRGRRR